MEHTFTESERDFLLAAISVAEERWEETFKDGVARLLKAHPQQQEGTKHRVNRAEIASLLRTDEELKAISARLRSMIPNL